MTGPLSQRWLCPACGEANTTANAIGLNAKTGPAYERWRAGMVRFLQLFENGRGDYAKERHAWVDAVSLDDLRAQTTSPPARRKRRKA